MLRRIALAGLAILLASSLRFGGAEAAPAFVSVWSQYCDPDGGVQVTLTWNGANPSAVSQFIDISLNNNSWQQGTFAGASVAPSDTWMTAKGLMPNAVYFVRVNQLLSNGWWDHGPTFYFVTANYCAKVLAFQAPPPMPDDEAPPEEDIDTGDDDAGLDEDCHEAYYGACLAPDALDYDCEGSGGNGPDFVAGPVYLSGEEDPFELDADGDGIGCNEIR